jgi:hypothetical protein
MSDADGKHNEALRLTSFDAFRQLLEDRAAEVVALDVRGTLLQAPRGGRLTRAFAPEGVATATLEAMDEQVPGRVLRLYPATTSVVDWTLVTVLEAQDLGPTRGPIRCPSGCARALESGEACRRRESWPCGGGVAGGRQDDLWHRGAGPDPSR